MTPTTALSSLAEAALSLVAKTEHLPLAALLQLRATSRYLCSELTGHMPPGVAQEAFCKEDRIQVSFLAISSFSVAHAQYLPDGAVNCSWSTSWSCSGWLALLSPGYPAASATCSSCPC